MKKIAACLVAVVALLWAVNGQAQNVPDDAIAAERPFLRTPLAGHRPNPFTKLSAGLPLNEFDLSGHRPKSFVRIAEELEFPNATRTVGFRPNSFVKISGSRPEHPESEDVARYGFDPQVKISGHLPASHLKISSQYPTPREN